MSRGRDELSQIYELWRSSSVHCKFQILRALKRLVSFDKHMMAGKFSKKSKEKRGEREGYYG